MQHGDFREVNEALKEGVTVHKNGRYLCSACQNEAYHCGIHAFFVRNCLLHMCWSFLRHNLRRLQNGWYSTLIGVPDAVSRKLVLPNNLTKIIDKFVNYHLVEPTCATLTGLLGSTDG